MSCMPSFKKVGAMYGENGGMPLCQKFHCEPIFTWLERTSFVANVVVTHLMQGMMTLSVISRLVGAIVELNAIANIHKYKRLHEGHHFILMAMEMHGAPWHDMDHFIKECARLFHDRWSGGHLSLSFCIQFFKQHVNITLQHVLASAIERKITLASDACSRPPIIIIFHNLHASDIRGVVGEIASYHKRD